MFWIRGECFSSFIPCTKNSSRVELVGLIDCVLAYSFVQTDMGNNGAKKVGLEKAYTEVDECVAGMVTVIDGATREKTSGTYAVWDGSEFPW